jgi:hypothetical protein
MTPEEKQEWICQILADEDAKAGVEQPAEKEEKEEKEDFVPCSGWRVGPRCLHLIGSMCCL